MKNRMQDLDFEQTVAFDSVKDFEFTDSGRSSVWMGLKTKMRMLFFIIYIKKWNWYLLEIT